MSKADLRVDWATHEAAKYACEHWHYSRVLPPSKTAKIGVWECGKFVGVVVFGVGATSDLCKRYGLQMQEGCELVRVALTHHANPVSRIVGIALKMIKKKYSGLRLCVSFADPEQGHCGSIYQAMNWVYTGTTSSSDEYLYRGKRWHGRAFRHKHKGMEKHPDVTTIKGSVKYRYLMPLDAEMRERILPLSKPYPKRTKRQASENPSDLGGSTPTRALHLSASEAGDGSDQEHGGGATPTRTLQIPKES